jgi:hypothetical protein
MTELLDVSSCQHDGPARPLGDADRAESRAALTISAPPPAFDDEPKGAA